jgi:hypothetical protein
MKYKVGDRVRINIESEFGQESINDIEKNTENGVGTITKAEEDVGYEINDMFWNWNDSHIECLVEETKTEPEQKIETNRFELMDFNEKESSGRRG